MPTSLTTDKIWPLIEPKLEEQILTSDRIWPLVQGKLDEYVKFIRIGTWIIGGIIGGLISLFVSLVIAILTIPGVKTAVVRSLIVDVRTEVNDYFETPAGITFLEDKTEKYLKGTRGNVAVDTELERRFNKMVAYSYSNVFQLSDPGLSHAISIFKADGDEGKLRCKAVYPTNKVKNEISIAANNLSIPKFKMRPKMDSNIAEEIFVLEKRNADLFERGTTNSPFHELIFTLNAPEKFVGSVAVECTVIVVGAAKWTG
jgi:hypothetical protein